MIQLFSCVLLCAVVYSKSIPYRPPLGPYGHPPAIVPPAIVPPVVVPPLNPLNPSAPLYPVQNPLIPAYNTPSPLLPGYNTPNPAIPGYNNPYYKGEAFVPILTYLNERGVDGSYTYSFTTADGKQAQESGFLKDAYIDNNGEPQGTQVVEGSYAYISPEGTPIQVNYVADENGFRPSGVHIPANGKGILPVPAVPILPVGIKDPQEKYDSLYNRYKPLNYRNPYYGQYNNPSVKPYDSRYRYDPKFNLHNPYRGLNKEVKEEPKKENA